MKLLERRKATRVRKKREASREKRTILRLASRRSRRIVTGCVVEGKTFSLSPMTGMCKGRAVGGRGEKGKVRIRMKQAMLSRSGFLPTAVIGKRGI